MAENQIRLALDIEGFEGKKQSALEAALRFIQAHPNCFITVFGEINEKDKGYLNSRLVHQPSTNNISATDSIMSAIRKNDSSLMRAINSVKLRQTDALVSAAPTAAFVTLVHTNFSLLKGVTKAGFMPWVPSVNRKGFNIIDVGAHIDTSAIDLLNYAKLANVYVREIRKVMRPRIGVINIGTEEYKGLPLHQEINKILKNETSLNYIGFIEPKNLLDGICDVAVTDGYSGNLVLKSLEGTSATLGREIKKGFKKPWFIINALFAIPVLKGINKVFDYKNNAGAMVLGLDAIAIKTHGAADYQQFYSSLRLAYQSVEKDIINKMKFVLEKNE